MTAKKEHQRTLLMFSETMVDSHAQSRESQRPGLPWSALNQVTTSFAKSGVCRDNSPCSRCFLEPVKNLWKAAKIWGLKNWRTMSNLTSHRDRKVRKQNYTQIVVWTEIGFDMLMFNYYMSVFFQYTQSRSINSHHFSPLKSVQTAVSYHLELAQSAPRTSKKPTHARIAGIMTPGMDF